MFSLCVDEGCGLSLGVEVEVGAGNDSNRAFMETAAAADGDVNGDVNGDIRRGKEMGTWTGTA